MKSLLPTKIKISSTYKPDKLPRTLVSFRHCLAEPRQPRKKNTPCFLDLAGGEISFEKGKGVFLSGFCPQGLGQVAEQCGRSFAKTIVWGKDFAKLRLICFWIRMSQMEKEGFGEEFSICSSFYFGGIRGGHICIILHSCNTMQVFLLCIYVIR